jgi:hypothetical protein
VIGHRYEETKGLDIVVVARLIRLDIKKAMSAGGLPAGLRVSVRTRRYAYGQGVDALIVDAPFPLRDTAGRRTVKSESAMLGLRSIIGAYKELEDYLARAIYDEASSADVSENVQDILRDAGWLPPDEVRNESADLQLAAIKLVKALQGRLVMQTEPPLVPLFMALAEAVEPYRETLGLAPYRDPADAQAPEGVDLRAALDEALDFVCHGTRAAGDMVPLVPAEPMMDDGRYAELRELARAKPGPAVAGRRVVPEVDTARMLELLGPRWFRGELSRHGAWKGEVWDSGGLVWSRISPSHDQVLADLMAWLEARR